MEYALLLSKQILFLRKKHKIVYVSKGTVTFFALARLKHIAALMCSFSYVLRPLKMPHTHFCKDCGLF